MRANSTIRIGALGAITLFSLAFAESAQAQGRQLQHTVTVQVPSVVKIIPDPIAVGPTGLPILRVVTNDPVLRRRLQQGGEEGLLAEALAVGRGKNPDPTADFRFTVVTP